MKRKIYSLVLFFGVLTAALLFTGCEVVPGPETVTQKQMDAAIAEALAQAKADWLAELASDATLPQPAEPNIENIQIISTSGSNLLAASKAVLSAVSVYCKFEQTTQYRYGMSWRTETSPVQLAGSGVIYRLDKEKGDAYVITNYHVVYYATADTANHISDDISLFLYGQEAEQYAIPATYIGGSATYDIAVLKVTGSDVLRESAARQAEFADSGDVAILDTAIAVGNPESNGLSATVGCVNVDSEYIEMLSADKSATVQMRLMRIDTPVNSGNSGGGLFNDRGEVIGIVNAKLEDGTVDNIGYAIPSNIARYVADNIIYYCDGTDRECVYRCLLGITVQVTASRAEYVTVSDDDRNVGRVKIVETVCVSEVQEGSLAGGVLQAGDEIRAIRIGDRAVEVTRMYQLIDFMLNARVGDEVIVTVVRGGNTMDLRLTIGEANLTPYL